MRQITRREALGQALAGAGAATLAVSGCSGGPSAAAGAPTGSSLSSTWSDPVGDGQLRVTAGEPLLHRVELGIRAAPVGVLGTLAHVSDAHVLDASSPARVTFLDRLGAPLQSTFRPQETLTAQVLSGMAAAVRSLRPGLVIQGGDLIDNDQSNELTQALAALKGGAVRPGSTPAGYFGVQGAGNPDPFYYRPDVDAPQHPGLLQAAARSFRSRGLGSRCLPVLGDHDALVAGEIVPTPVTRALAVGERAVWELPTGLRLPAGVRAGSVASPDGPPDPQLVDELLSRALSGSTVKVPASQARRQMALDEVITRLRAASPGIPFPAAPRLDYALDVGAHLRLIVLDLVRRDGGSGGLVAADQPAWLERQLAGAGTRWVIVVSHQPLASSAGGDSLLALLDQRTRVIATLSGHTHRNRVLARPTSAGGYWMISTASLIDYPQQARALRVLCTADGGVAIQTWMLDHVFPGSLGRTARELSFIDAQGGRPKGFAGSHQDRNVTLHRGPAKAGR